MVKLLDYEIIFQKHPIQLKWYQFCKHPVKLLTLSDTSSRFFLLLASEKLESYILILKKKHLIQKFVVLCRSHYLIVTIKYLTTACVSGCWFINSLCAHVVFERSTDGRWHDQSGFFLRPTPCGGVSILTLTKTKIKDLINHFKDLTFYPPKCRPELVPEVIIF